MLEHLGAAIDSVTVTFVQLISACLDESWLFAVNPGAPIGATPQDIQIKALVSWAAEARLSDVATVAWEHGETPGRTQPQRGGGDDAEADRASAGSLLPGLRGTTGSPASCTGPARPRT
jgi:hypothetical protein